MSQENIEVVRRKLKAHNVEDTADFVDQWDPECEWFTVTGSQMDAAPYLGHEGIRRYLAEKAELWSELRFDTEEALEGKDYDIVVVGFLRGTGRGSGARVEQRIGLVYELRGRKIRYCRAYRDPQDALAAAGFSEKADAAQAEVQVTRSGRTPSSSPTTTGSESLASTSPLRETRASSSPASARPLRRPAGAQCARRVATALA